MLLFCGLILILWCNLVVDMALTSEEVNYLVFRYLQESGAKRLQYNEEILVCALLERLHISERRRCARVH